MHLNTARDVPGVSDVGGKQVSDPSLQNELEWPGRGPLHSLLVTFAATEGVGRAKSGGNLRARPTELTNNRSL